jgi:Xaa-Pro dipeptidase
MASTPFEEIQRRISSLQSLMADQGMDGALIVQQADLFYFSGTGQDAHLFVPTVGSAVLLVRKNFDRAREDSPLEHVYAVKNLIDLKTHVESATRATPRKLGMELDVLPVNHFRQYEQLFAECALVDGSPLIKTVRMIKSEYELTLMKRAAALNDSMFALARDVLREGMTELEFSSLLESFYRTHGHQGLVRVRSFNQVVFYGHVMSGSNLAVPSCSVGPTGGPGPHPSLPHGAGLKKIRRHEPVQVDYVAIVEGYMVDQARTFYLGEPPEKFLRAHSVALRIQNELARQGVPGQRAEKLYDTAMAIAEAEGLSEGFLGYPQPVPFVGHGVGMELDELPLVGRKSPHILQEGMVVALEPKFIFPGEGLAGIENTFLVTKNGLEKLTPFDDAIQILA